MRYAESLAISPNETMVGRKRRRFLSRPTSLRPDRSALGPVRMHDVLELLRVKDSALRIFDLDVTNTHARPLSGKPQDILRVRDPSCHGASRQAAHQPVRRRHGWHADKHIGTRAGARRGLGCRLPTLPTHESAEFSEPKRG